ncbi:DUF948 domain-containing protein [Lacticaseibacillus paracasei]|uniref:DUF948 domain-containing protein n=1 Tax=Lacticaseibacillus paracasei TaxID=1597 RepID=UPI003CE797F4
MSGGEIAWIIAAIAFLIIALAIAIIAVRVSGVTKEIKGTVAETNKTLNTINGELGILTKEVEGLLAKSNTLLEDVNGKVAAIDPVFTAIGELGESVSDLNQSTRNLTERVAHGAKNGAKATVAARMSAKAFSMLTKKKHNDQ